MPNTATKTKRDMFVFHTLIGLAIAVIFRFLPNLPNVTDAGMNMLGAFLGTLYMWITTDTLIASLISVVLIVFTGYAPVNDILATYMNTVLIQMLFLMVMARSLAEAGVTKYIARFFLTVKIAKGRPWVFAFMVGLGCLLVGGFVDWLTPILLFIPILASVFEQVGYTKADKFPKIMNVLVPFAVIIGFPCPPYMGNVFLLINNYKSLTSELPEGPVVIPDGPYLSFALIMAILLLLMFILVAKFVLRPDTSKMKAFDPETIKQTDPLPPMNSQQKIVGIGMLVVIAFLLFPALLQNVPFMATIRNYTRIIPLAMVLILAVVRTEKKPVLNVAEILTSKQFAWPMVFMVATAFLLSSSLTNPATGVQEFLNYALSPMFSKMSITVFTIAILVVGYILTNICNSFVITVVLSPIVLTYCTATGANAIPIMMLLMYTALGTALDTPSASPIGALLHGNERLTPKDKYGYSLTFTLIELAVILLVGIPLANLLA